MGAGTRTALRAAAAVVTTEEDRMMFPTQYEAFRPWRFPTPTGNVPATPTNAPNKRRGPRQ